MDQQTATRRIRWAAPIALAFFAAGYTPGGCGGVVPKDGCEFLGEAQCLRNPICEASYETSAGSPCACPANASCDCPAYDPEPRFAGCHRRQPPPPPASCESLDEAACLARGDCKAVYSSSAAPAGSASGAPASDFVYIPPPDDGFVRCEPNNPTPCPLWACAQIDCPNGFKKDANGCETCECAPPNEPPPAKGCLATGCSGQICADQEMVSTCEWTPAYACYQSATCERQADGQCGWTMDQKLKDCLANP